MLFIIVYWTTKIALKKFGLRTKCIKNLFDYWVVHCLGTSKNLVQESGQILKKTVQVLLNKYG